MGESGGKWVKPTSNDVFRGATKVTLDDKGRMVMPTRHRDAIQERAQGRLVVTVDRDQCLLIYPLPDWEQTERKLMSLPSLHAQARRLQRLMVGHATDVELDGHGRFLLPPELREFAGLGRHGMLIGQGNRFELWDEARWGDRRNFWLKSEEAATDLPSLLDSLSL
ncbi:MAG TPA: division/cell wall cluster transcriptional repressor MraZ [Steroidobacteraceae bacterium]|nr:division/cell wall cluster transcriptional repressor MraZ [Steroidobacteraceae bacterium]